VLVLFTVLVNVLLGYREIQRGVLCQNRLSKLGSQATAGVEGRLPWLQEGPANWVMQASHLDPASPDLRVPELLCPADSARTAADSAGGLSYVANGGFGFFRVEADGIQEVGTHTVSQDLDGDGKVSDEEIAIAKATGIFWRPATKSPAPRGPSGQMTLQWISNRDGLDSTLMLSENLNARSWSSLETGDLAFVLGRGQLKFAGSPVGPEALHVQSVDLGPFRPNANLGTQPGRSPVPSSRHGKKVNVLFCSGRGQMLSEQIDGDVYERLLTSGGSRYGEPAPGSGEPSSPE